MTAMRVKDTAPIVVLGGNAAHIKGFLDNYKPVGNIQLLSSPLCLLQRLAECPPQMAVFLPGYAKESLEAALEKDVWCLVFVEYKVGDVYPERCKVTWYYAAPDIRETALPFCTLATFAKQVMSLLPYAY